MGDLAAPKPRCRMCAVPLQAAHAQSISLCAACLQSPLPLAATWCAVDYAYPWRDLVLRFKSQGAGLAAPLAQLWADAHEARQWLQGGALISPVPSGTQRMQERGYNHSWLLAQAFAAQLPQPALWAHRRALVRTDEPLRQQGAGRAQRLKQMRNAFVVPPEQRAHLAGQRVLLIDDVMTTGATLCAAALALKHAGAAEVAALVLARTAPD